MPMRVPELEVIGTLNSLINLTVHIEFMNPDDVEQLCSYILNVYDEEECGADSIVEFVMAVAESTIAYYEKKEN